MSRKLCNCYLVKAYTRRGLITSSLNPISLRSSSNIMSYTAIANIPQLLDSGDCLCIGAIINREVSNIFVITLVRVSSDE